jgi:exosortase A-associated hydrolase 1
MADVSYSERALTFSCGGERLVGVLAEPAIDSDIGVVIVVGGPQYRAGSHRQFVLLARSLAAAGVVVLRFDYRGMGDATGAARSFDDIDDDVAAAIDSLSTACPAIKKIALWGLCDGASAALLYWQRTRDARVAGMTLLNPWVRSEATLARTHLKHYYGRRFLAGAFWAKVARGELNVATTLRSIGRTLAAAGERRRPANASGAMSFQDRMADGLESFSGAVLILLSGRDLTANEFVEWIRASPQRSSLLERTNVERHDVADADHTFSTQQWRREAECRTLDWLQRTLAAR